MSRSFAPSAVLIALLLAGCHGSEANTVDPRGNFSLEEARLFQEFPLYALGEAYGELPLVAVQRTFDGSAEPPPVRPNYVDFIYGTCEAAESSEGRCSPPLSIQVWAACERNPMVYSPLVGQEQPIEVRGVPGFFYERGTRLELSTGTSTVVIFASGRQEALAAAAALRGVNNPVSAGQPLPEPAYTLAEGGIVSVIPCAYEDPKQQIEQDPETASAVARKLRRQLAAGAARDDNKPVRSVECFRSPAPARVGALTDAHECMVAWRDGSFVTWCVLSGEQELVRATLPSGCADAASGDSSFIPAVDPGGNHALAWGAHATAACNPWKEKQLQAIGGLDQDLVVEDLSYVWFIMRPIEAGIVRDLRVIPGRAGAAGEAVALYERRLAAIDAGLSAWQAGKRRAAYGHFDRAEELKLPLSQLLATLQADACSPP